MTGFNMMDLPSLSITAGDTLRSAHDDQGRARAAPKPASPPAVVLAGSFTVDPLLAPLQFILGEAGLALPVKLAPYGQPFQQLLDPQSLYAQNRGGANVLLVRLADWVRRGGQTDSTAIARQVDDLVEALRSAAARALSPLLVAICPVPQGSPTVAYALLREQGERLVHDLVGLPNLHCLPMAEYESWPSELVHDGVQNRLGHVPYTPRFFAALARQVARLIFVMRSAPVKVLVLDCDNTIWRGVVGEDGVAGITIGPRERDLQRFALAKKSSGIILCLASKNNSADVCAVLEQRKDMILRLGDIVAMQIHWQPKSASIRALADGLNLGLDSFAFVDDSPLECAEVRAACPEVLVIGFSEHEDPAAVLGQVWPLDVARQSPRRIGSGVR